MRRAARADTNQPDIVRTLRSLGASIWHTHTIGRGGPDIVVGYCGVNVLAEIKRDEREQLTLAEAQFHATWQGRVDMAYAHDRARRPRYRRGLLRR